METETTAEFPNGGKAIVEQILVSEVRNKSKRAVWDPSRKVNHVSKVICNRTIIAEFPRLISSTRIGKPKTKTLADGLIERTSSMLDEIESKTMHKAEEDD